MLETFSFEKLIFDLKTSKTIIQHWKDFESLLYKLAKIQDGRCRRNVEESPDVTLSNGFGLEAKVVASTTRDINLNSAAPDPKTYYVVGYCPSTVVKDVAIVNGANYYCREITDIQKINTSLKDLSNKMLRYRTRIMWQLKSPFVTWGRGYYLIDEFGVKKLLA